MLVFLTNDGGTDQLLIDDDRKISVHIADGKEASIKLWQPPSNPRAHYAGISKEVAVHDLDAQKKALLMRSYNWAIAWIEEIGYVR